jgi:pre-mRNA-splicing helicase BRR2
MGEIENDPIKAKQTGEKLIETLNDSNVMQVQNKLIQLLGVQNMKLVGEIFENRKKIFYLTKLEEADSEESKAQIFNQIRQDPEA